MGVLSVARALALLPLILNFVQAADTAGSSGTCSSTSKCVSGCCSKSGYCGFGPDFCGESICISDCDAQAECGPYAPIANTTCPLNVCCSQYGFCGTTDDFCGTGCSSGCDPVDQPSCSGTSSEAIYGGYFEAFNYEHACDNLEPKDIDVAPWTHLYYAFAGIDTDDSVIQFTYQNDEKWIPQMVALKQKTPSLQVWLSIGGWDLGGLIFSDMVRFKGTRSNFIGSAIEVMDAWGFDGIDIDWEYPAALDRGGRDEDTANLVTFMQKLKEACGNTYGISATLPSSYYYLKGFDVKGMAEYVDHFNFMSYDIHGTWDGDSAWTSSVINPHTNLTEISEGLDLLWRAGVDPAKVNLGLGFYGRSFSLNDTSCTTPGCPFDTSDFVNGGGAPGQCTESSGILSDYEISRVLDEYDPEIVYDEIAAVNWITWDSNQWVSFDNAKTLKQKADFANQRCLGGLFAWTLDEGGPGSLINPNNLNASDTSMSGADTEGGDDGSGDVYIADTVAEPKSNTITGIAPLNMIVAPSTLPTPITIQFEPLETSIEVAWTTTTTVTVDGEPTVSHTIARTIQSTTFTIAPTVLSIIPWRNWNITAGNVTRTSTTLFPSIALDPIVFMDSGNPENITNGTFATHTVIGQRTFYPPPWPWSTSPLPGNIPTPTVTFTQGGPPGPTCTANCGQKCVSYCEGPCLDCDDPQSESNFDDPIDPDPPSNSKCSGSDCTNNKCTGPLCFKKGCTGTDCVDLVCIGPHCEETGCIGDDCGTGGKCDGDSCITVGCEGDDCNGAGSCFGLSCISIGCFGSLCDSATGLCSGRDCTKISCSGSNCKNGQCKGDGCTPEDKDCESEEADVCTETVYSTYDTIASTSATETSTSCQTITACSVEATTTTTTIDNEDLATAEVYWNPVMTLDTAAASILAKSMEAVFASIYDPTTSTTAAPSTTKESTSTTSKASSTKTVDWSKYEPTVTVTCQDESLCLKGATEYAKCDESKDLIVDTDLYTTDVDGGNSGECYFSGNSEGYGCQLEVQGYDIVCEIAGESMKAAYEAVRSKCGTGCGVAKFGSIGCQVGMTVVETGNCGTKSKGGIAMSSLS